MREINIAGVGYKIEDVPIAEWEINPWKAQVRQTGGLEYSDFSNAEMEEYHDFRNGIGKKRGLGSDARLEFSEGIDFTIEGQAVLGGLVNTADYAEWQASTAYTAGAGSALFSFVIPTTANGYCYECTTAGTSGATEPTWGTTVGGTTNDTDGTLVWTCRNYLATAKIIDFLDKTYFIQNSRILRFGVVTAFTSPTGFVDPDSYWTGETNIYDDDTTTNAATGNVAAGVWTSFVELTHAAIKIESVRYWFTRNDTTDIDIDLYYSSAWNHLYSGAGTQGQWVTIDVSAVTVTAARVRFYNSGSGTGGVNFFEFDFGQVGANSLCCVDNAFASPIDAIVVTDSTDEYLVVSSATAAVYTADGITWTALTGCQGYLAFYDLKLFSIDTDGITVRASPVKDIDGTWTTFDLTGRFGTLYKLFSGKLLADQTPVLYFLGNRNLFSLDVTNERAYEQEISYPPTTYAGHSGMYWNANIWVATGAGITKVAPSMATAVGTDQDDGLPSGYQGDVYDMLPIGNWLVYCVNGGTSDKSSIFKRNASYGGNLQVYTTSTSGKPIACLCHSPSSLYPNGRLWFGEDTGVKYMMFPDTTSNVKQISTFQYVDDSGYGTFPIFRKLAAIPKVVVGVAAITKSCDADDYIEVFYGLNGATATTSLGTLKSSPRPTLLTFGSGLGTAFYTIQFAVKLFRNGGNTTSPELESLMFYWYATPARIRGWTFNVLATDDKSAETFAAFEAIRDTVTLVAFYPSGDTAKTSYNVKLTRMPSRQWFEEMGAKEGMFQVELQEIFRG